MKKLFILTIVLILGTTFNANSQKFAGLQKSPTDIAYAKASRNAKPVIKVIYSRPQKKGREIFGSLIPYNKVWRTGADESTEIKFFKDMKFGETVIKAGTYSLFTIPGEKEWTIILNTELDSWGAYTYDEGKDVARIKVPVENGDELEVFSITFIRIANNAYEMVLGWDSTIVKVPFSF